MTLHSCLSPSEIQWDCVRAATTCVCKSCIRSSKRVYQPAVVGVRRISKTKLNTSWTRQFLHPFWGQRGQAPRMATLKAVYSLFLSDLWGVSSIRPTPMATFCRGSCGAALLRVPAQYDDPVHETVSTHRQVFGKYICKLVPNCLTSTR